MNEPTIEHLFALYVDHGDVDALGDVFDRAAPELLRVALHLVGRPEDADDLLQSTFLTALEKRARWERSRPLLPWLIGILEKHGQDLRRKRVRQREDAPSDAREVVAPDASAAFRETSEVFERALREVPDTYRSALLAYFRDGRKAVEIASELGVAPGTVRMRVHRGLELLKRALPAGAALGAALSLGSTALGATRGLAAVRIEVLRRGVELAPSAAVAGAAAATWTGSVLMKSLGLAAAVVLAFVLWRAASDGPGEGARAGAARGDVASAFDEARGGAAGSKSVTQAPSAPSEVDEAARRSTAVVTPSSAGHDEGWNAALIGFSGRIVDEARKPLAGLEVRLMEFDPKRFALTPTAMFEASEELTLELERTRTDADGRFRVRGARRGSLQALFVDAGGPRGTLHVIDRAPKPGANEDLGEIALLSGRTVRGRIARSDGAPIPGARVIALPVSADNVLAKELAPMLAQNLLHAQAFGGLHGRATTIDLLPAPSALRILLDELPFPTERTSPNGEFAFSHAPDGAAILLVDAPGALTHIQPLVAGREELGVLVVKPSIELRGRVVDENGLALSGARVLAAGGRALSSSDEAFTALHGDVVTDDDGRFTIEGLAEREPLAVAVQRAGAIGWELVRDPPNSGDAEVRVKRSPRWSVIVHDGAGRPLPRASVEFGGDSMRWQLSFGGAAHTLVSACDERGRASATVASDTRCFARVTAPGFASSILHERVPATGLETDVTLGADQRLDVSVVDARDGSPVRDALVRVASRGELTLASARTNERGTASVARGGTPVAKAERVVVEHPAFAIVTRDGLTPDTSVLTIELGAAGSIEARVRQLDQPAQATLFFTSESDGSVLLARTDEQGIARIEGVAPGRWRYGVRTSLRRIDQLVDDPYAGIDGELVEVEAGRTTSFVVQLLAARSRAADGDAVLRGRVRVDGVPGAGLRVQVWARAGAGWQSVGAGSAETDSRGAFTVGRCPRGALHLEIFSGDVKELIPFHAAHELELTEQDDGERTIDLRSHLVELRVLDARGEPLLGAEATLTSAAITTISFPQHGSTDVDGRVKLRVGNEQRYRASALHEEHGAAARELDVRFDSPADVVELRLAPGVPCKGVALLEGFSPVQIVDPAPAGRGEVAVAIGAKAAESDVVIENAPVSLTIYRKDDRFSQRFVTLATTDGRAPFELRGLEPGEYLAIATSGNSFSKPFPFTLGPSGDSALEIRLRAID